MYEKWNELNRDLLYGSYVSVKDFLENTNYSWFFRTTDDVLVHIPNFKWLISDLEKKYNPLKDFVFKGQLCGSYLHGGPGWIVSRALAEKIVQKLNDKYDSPDDIVFSQIVSEFMKNPREWNSDKFVATPLHKFSLNTIEKNNFAEISPCKTQLFARVNDIAVWHAGDQDMKVVTHGIDLIENLPNSIYIGKYSDSHAGFCQQT